VVPAFNESQSIGEVVSALRKAGLPVLVVDDGSSDSTSVMASSAGGEVLKLPINLGVGGALRAGFRFAIANRYDAVVQVDADGQHPVDQVPRLIQAAVSQDAHLVIGSRYLAPDSTLIPTSGRRLAMRILASYVSLTAGYRITDSTSGFRIIREPLLSEFAREFPTHYLGDTFEATVNALRAGYRVAEVPASLSPRRVGESATSNAMAVLLVFRALVLTTLRLTRAR